MSEDAATQLKEKQDADNRELAKSAWAGRDATTAKSVELAINFGLHAIRAAGLMNAAGAAAFLGFLSANAKLLKGYGADIDHVMQAFIVGVFAGALALGGAYWSQYLYTRGLSDHEKTINHPYVIDGTSAYARSGVALHVATVFCVLISYLGFIKGSLSLIDLAKRAVLSST